MTKKRILGCLRVPPGVWVPPVEYHWSSGSNPAEDDGFVTAEGLSHVVRFYGILKIPTVWKGYFVGKIHGHFSPCSPALQLGVYADYRQGALVG
jgi:hypothetical protein